MGGLAGGADLIIIPEFHVTLQEVVGHLHKRRAAGKDFSIIVIAEGIRMDDLAVREDAGRDAFGTSSSASWAWASPQPADRGGDRIRDPGHRPGPPPTGRIAVGAGPDLAHPPGVPRSTCSPRARAA